jgi:hypothetical protein
MNDLETLKDIAEQAEAHAREARDRYNAALIEAHPVKVGMVMTRPIKRSQPYRAKVSSITVRYGEVETMGRYFLKDGSVGGTEHRLSRYDHWEVE